MSLACRQAALAKLLTNASLRQQFKRTPELVREELGLDESDVAFLSRIAADQVDHHARSLLRKRLGYARNTLTATAQSLGGEFQPTFLRFASEHQLPLGERRYERDALAFLDWFKTPDSFELLSAIKLDRIRIDMRQSRREFYAGVFLEKLFGNDEVDSERLRIALWIWIPWRRKYSAINFGLPKIASLLQKKPAIASVSLKRKSSYTNSAPAGTV